MAQSSNARMVTSIRGGQILEHGGYRYQRRSTNRDKTKIHWRCTERDICNGTTTTNFNVSAGKFLI